MVARRKKVSKNNIAACFRFAKLHLSKLQDSWNNGSHLLCEWKHSFPAQKTSADAKSPLDL